MAGNQSGASIEPVKNATVQDGGTFFGRVPKEDLLSWMITPGAVVFQSVCICANAVIFMCVCSFRTYRSPANYLLANLCLVSTLFISNILAMNFQSRFQLFSYGPFACIVSGGLHRLPLPLMTLAMMALSVDRCRIARNPLNHPSKRKVILQILAIWLLSFFLTIPRAVSSEFAPDFPSPVKCRKVAFLNRGWAQAGFAVLNFLCIYALPATLLVKELRETWKQIKYLGRTCQEEQGRSFTRRCRLMRNSCIFTWIFVLCWLPYGLISFPYDWLSPARLPPWLDITRDLMKNVVMIQACINPLLLQVLSFDVQDFIMSCFNY